MHSKKQTTMDNKLYFWKRRKNEKKKEELMPQKKRLSCKTCFKSENGNVYQHTNKSTLFKNLI